MKFQITGKLFDKNVPEFSRHTITDKIDACSPYLAEVKFREINPGYVISTIFPVA